MKPRRTPDSNLVYELPGGNEDNSLWCERLAAENGGTRILSEWVLTDAEREMIAAGGRVCLIIHGEPIPPVAMFVMDRDADGAPVYLDSDAQGV